MMWLRDAVLQACVTVFRTKRLQDQGQLSRRFDSCAKCQNVFHLENEKAARLPPGILQSGCKSGAPFKQDSPIPSLLPTPEQ